MKRLIAAGIILALVLTVSFFGIGSVRRCGKEVEQRIGQIRAHAAEGTNGAAADFTAYWENAKDSLSVFVNHADISEIGRAAAQMAAAEQSGSIPDLLEAADQILFIMNGIKEDERFSLFSFL